MASTTRPYKHLHLLLITLAWVGLSMLAAQSAHAFVADDANGFTSGGDAPEHSWTDTLRPNPHTYVFDLNGNPVSPQESKFAPQGSGAYRDTECHRPPQYPNTDAPNPPLSICKLQEMANQIHAVADNYVAAFMLMTEQFTTVMMAQVHAIGMFMDADMQIDTQREIQSLIARAHKDYHPSEQLCRFGTFMRSVSNTQRRMEVNKQAFNEILMANYLAKEDTPTADGFGPAMDSRIEKFKEFYCDPADNNGGLDQFCTDPGSDQKRYNKDIDYQRSLGDPLTLDIAFGTRAGTAPATVTDDEQDMIALARNLYWPAALETPSEEQLERKDDKYAAFRSLVATTNVAHNSFAHIMAMKAKAEETDTPDEKGWHYMKALLRDLGVTDDEEVDKILGEYPSYYAQMEMLTKKIYQDPDFYTNLYDKPQNVRRINASLDAIKLMQGRDRFEAALRREMLVSSLLEQALDSEFPKINANLKSN